MAHKDNPKPLLWVMLVIMLFLQHSAYWLWGFWGMFAAIVILGVPASIVFFKYQDSLLE